MVFGFILSACSNMDAPSIETANIKTMPNKTITQAEAVKIAGNVLEKNTASRASSEPSVQYVLNERSSRSIGSDTLAYVINYPDDQGFVIVASDRKVHPVLAFSKTGKFSFDNEIAKANFIDNIAAYMDNADDDNIYNVTDNFFAGCYYTNPTIKISLGQSPPWNKYIIEENPGCAIGCVTVAAALVMVHAKDELTYHGSHFQLNSIIEAIKKHQDEDYESESDAPVYTYEQAADSMAKFMYWIGKDVGMRYNVGKSSASPDMAFNLCKKLGYTIPSDYVLYNEEAVVRYIKNGYIIFIYGTYPDGSPGGHTWVADGCIYCVDKNDPSIILDAYIHCDWGWDGLSNGYFSGAVFSTYYADYKPYKYFAVQLKNSKPIVGPLLPIN